MEVSQKMAETDTQLHQLSDTWTLWAHLPHDTDWTVKSYKKVFDFNTVEQTIAITESLPDKLIKNCMLFLMREGIMPTWEDPRNREGGCFSYKVNNKSVAACWRALSCVLVGETLTDTNNLRPCINGITISPKKNFCIIKIWLSTCKYQNASVIKDIKGITSHGCLFKKHVPEY